MKDTLLSNIQLSNLFLLIAIHTAGREDPCDACLRFQLVEEELLAIASLNLSELWELIIRAGQISLFLPRPDLATFISMPRDGIATYAAAKQLRVYGGDCL